MLVLPYRNDVAGDPIRKHKDGFGGGIPRTFAEFPSRLDNAEFLNGLEAVCEESNVRLGFDEVITGFQTAFGGCQEHYGITPDFATYGKAVAAGLPIGTVVGRNEIMNCFSGKDGAREYSRRHLQRQSPVDDHGRSGCRRNARQPRQQGDDLQPPHGTGQSPGLRGDDFCMKHQFQAQLMNAGPWGICASRTSRQQFTGLHRRREVGRAGVLSAPVGLRRDHPRHTSWRSCPSRIRPRTSTGSSGLQAVVSALEGRRSFLKASGLAV